MFFLGNNPLTGSIASSTINETSFFMLFILGIFSSFHCIGMCSGIILTQTFNNSEKIQGLIQLIAALFMIILGLNMIGIKLLKKFTFPSIFNKSTCVNNHKNPFIVGFLNRLLPCGLLQTMQLYALSS